MDTSANGDKLASQSLNKSSKSASRSAVVDLTGDDAESIDQISESDASDAADPVPDSDSEPDTKEEAPLWKSRSPTKVLKRRSQIAARPETDDEDEELNGSQIFSPKAPVRWTAKSESLLQQENATANSRLSLDNFELDSSIQSNNESAADDDEARFLFSNLFENLFFILIF